MRLMTSLALALTIFALPQGEAATPPDTKLWRLDCGDILIDDLNVFSDTYTYLGRSKSLTAGCYLIKHGDAYMLWDTGLPKEDLGLALQGKGAKGETLATTIVDQLSRLGVDKEKIKLIGISHYHYDHIGQAVDFPQAKLLMGRGDIEVLRKPDNPRAKALEHWLKEGGELEEVSGDKDVFGDKTVVMLDLPGHTPGHHGLLVKLPRTGYVLLSGDVTHFQENFDNDGIPSFNFSRSLSLASLDRFRKIGEHLHAITAIQHEPKDIAKLPKFPEFAQ